MATDLPAFETISLGRRQDGIAELLLNRPLKGNSLNEAMWQEIPEALRHLDALADVRVVSGEPRVFYCVCSSFPASSTPVHIMLWGFLMWCSCRDGVLFFSRLLQRV
jgi:hypothetical protein